jgi:hypothetical protein
LTNVTGCSRDTPSRAPSTRTRVTNHASRALRHPTRRKGCARLAPREWDPHSGLGRADEVVGRRNSEGTVVGKPRWRSVLATVLVLIFAAGCSGSAHGVARKQVRSVGYAPGHGGMDVFVAKGYPGWAKMEAALPAFLPRPPRQPSHCDAWPSFEIGVSGSDKEIVYGPCGRIPPSIAALKCLIPYACPPP